jgi:hypothetical protein
MPRRSAPFKGKPFGRHTRPAPMPRPTGPVPAPPWASTGGPLGTGVSMAGMGLPWPWDRPVLALGLRSLVAPIGSDGNRPALRAPLVGPVLGCVVATGLSSLLSEELGRSARCSAALLPAVLLGVVIAASVRGPPQRRLLSLTWARVGLGLASAVRWPGWRTGGPPPMPSWLAWASPWVLPQRGFGERVVFQKWR